MEIGIEINDNKPVPAALREIADNLDDLIEPKLDKMWMVGAYTHEDNPSIFGTFHARNNDELNFRKDVRALMATRPRHYPSIHEDVKLIEVHNNTDNLDEIDSLAKLIRKAASTLESLGQIKVLDVIAHDFVDDDALNRPYIRIYYEYPKG